MAERAILEVRGRNETARAGGFPRGALLKWTAAALTMLWLSALLLPELLLSAGSAVWLGFQIPGRERAAALSGALVGLTLGWLSLVSWGRQLGLPI